MLITQKSPSLSRNLALQTFDELLIVFSTKVHLLYLLYSTAKRYCLLHLIKQNCLLKIFPRTLILMTQVSREFQVRYLALFILFTVIDDFRWFWMGSLHKNIQLILEFLRAPFLVLHFSYYTLMTFLMMLSVILLSMLMILLCFKCDPASDLISTEYCRHVWAGAPSCFLELLHKLQNGYAGLMVLHLLSPLNSWVIIKL